MTKPLYQRYMQAIDKGRKMKTNIDQHLVNYLNNLGIYDRKQIESIRFNPLDKKGKINITKYETKVNKNSQYRISKRSKGKRSNSDQSKSKSAENDFFNLNSNNSK